MLCDLAEGGSLLYDNIIPGFQVHRALQFNLVLLECAVVLGRLVDVGHAILIHRPHRFDSFVNFLGVDWPLPNFKQKPPHSYLVLRTCPDVRDHERKYPVCLPNILFFRRNKTSFLCATV